MFKTLKNAWGIPELRKKMMFTLMILLVYSLGRSISVPFVDVDQLADNFNATLSNTVLGMWNVMSGGTFANASIFCLSINPYINASIIVQLLTVAIPALERMAKEQGEEGKKKIDLITRLTTIGLGLLMGVGYYFTLLNSTDSNNVNLNLIPDANIWKALVIVLTFTAGSAVVMWLGEQITEKGIGNGISMILFAGIIASLPSMFSQIFQMTWWLCAIVMVILVVLVLLILFINDAERRIPVQYAKRVVGRKVYGGQSTNMPIKVAMSGVMPVIFAQSICTLPGTICEIGKSAGWKSGWFYQYVAKPSSVVYIVAYGLLIFFFSWFYSTIQYDPVEVSNNLKKNGGFIPGFRPGKPTADFIKKVIGKLVAFGAVYLAIVALVPVIGGAIGTAAYEAVQNSSATDMQKLLYPLAYLGVSGTSIIILISVALETAKALEAQMLMRHYKGFLD